MPFVIAEKQSYDFSKIPFVIAEKQSYVFPKTLCYELQVKKAYDLFFQRQVSYLTFPDVFYNFKLE